MAKVERAVGVLAVQTVEAKLVETVEAKLAEGEEVRLVEGEEVRLVVETGEAQLVGARVAVREVREAGTWRRRRRHRWHREAYSMHLPQFRMK